MSDFLTGHEYFDGQTFTVSDVKHFNDSRVANLTSSLFLNATTRICNLESNENDTYNKFSCTQFHYWYGIMTFVFIFAPSASTLCALIGQRNGLMFSALWGMILFFIGLIAIFAVDDRTSLVFGIFMTIFGPFLLLCGVADNNFTPEEKWWQWKLNWTFFFIVPLIIPLSPIIMVFIHTLALFKPESEYIQMQKRVVKRGECNYEASHQLILQMFVVMRTLNPSWKQIASIAVSALSVSIADTEMYLATQNLEFGLNMASLKCFFR